MSRETLLDDAIAKAKEAEDWQLVEWLRMARGGESAARWYTERLRDANRTIRELMNENAKLRELATYALRYIVEVWCEGGGRDLYRGKPCEDCADAGSSDCPKCMPRMFDVSGIEVDE